MSKVQWRAALHHPVVRRGLTICWLLTMALVIVGSLLPSAILDRVDPAQEYLNDKQQHFLAYLALAVLPPLFAPGRRMGWALAAAMLVLGIGLEYAQRLTPDRTFDGADMVADALGVLAGMIVSWITLRVVRKQHAV